MTERCNFQHLFEKKKHESRFLEAPFVRMLRMRSASLKIATKLKVSKSQKQNTKFSHTPKNQRNFVHFLALAFKSG